MTALELLHEAHRLLAGAKYGTMEMEARGYLADAIERFEKELPTFHCQECLATPIDGHDSDSTRCPKDPS